jgi:hypothetical protein
MSKRPLALRLFIKVSLEARCFLQNDEDVCDAKVNQSAIYLPVHLLKFFFIAGLENHLLVYN